MAAVASVADGRRSLRRPATPSRVLVTVLAAASVAVAFLHYYRLASIPGGAFVDEVEVYWNALGIATDGRDAHGNAWPLFFQPFVAPDDWKNPIMIYAVALAFRLFGPSMALARAVPSTFSLAAAALIGVLGWQLARNRWLAIGAFLTAAVTPWLFTVGRNAFETAALRVAVSWVVQGGAETFAYWDRMPITVIQRGGPAAAGIVWIQDQTTPEPPGTAIVTGAGDARRSARYVRTFSSPVPTAWGGTTTQPELELWMATG